MANLKRVPTWLLVKELLTRNDVSCSKDNTPITITIKNIENPNKDTKGGKNNG